MASTTFQNYFRLYDKLSGMTGTPIPKPSISARFMASGVWLARNIPMKRLDMNDLVFMSQEEKLRRSSMRQSASLKKAPVLVGTASVETSEELRLTSRRRVLITKY